MSSTDKTTLESSLQQALLKLARNAIRGHFDEAASLPMALHPQLQQQGACFVTLSIDGRLRGCIGNTEAESSLANAVVQNALGAAFRDPRFPPLRHEELGDARIAISILGEAQTLTFQDTVELAALLSPNEDGLILACGSRRGLFLPQVWDSLPDPMQFIHQLKCKANIATEAEPPQLRAWKFNVQYFNDEEGDI